MRKIRPKGSPNRNSSLWSWAVDPLYIVAAVFGLSLLVIAHETGHYLVARAFGMRVIRYSIGFGPALFRYKPKNSPTTFQVCAIPFLAYVQIAGMNPHEELEDDDPGSFHNASLFGRIATIAAGPLANYLAAVVLTFGLGLHGWGAVGVKEVTEDSPAAEAGLKDGDVVLAVSGERLFGINDLIHMTSPRGGKPTVYDVERNGERKSFTIVPKTTEGGRAVIGIMLGDVESRPMELGEALSTAAIFPWRFTKVQLEGIANMIETRDTEGVAGPVRMGQVVAAHAEQGIGPFVYVLILLSVALGLFNLLPLPALDGGRLVFLGYELITRRRPNEQLEVAVHTVGILLLLGVLLLVTFREVAGLG